MFNWKPKVVSPVLATGVLSVCLAVGALSSGSAIAQTYPTKPVTILVGFPPGGPLDWMSRVLAPKLQERWNQTVIVENRPGAGGLLAVQAVQKAPPDGHMFMPHSQQVAMVPLFVKQAEIDLGRNLQPLGRLFWSPYTVAASAKAPGNNLREFIAYAKANPGKVNFAAIAQAGQYFDSVAMARVAGIDVVQVPYKGAAAALTALLADESQVNLATTAGIDAHFKSGKLKPFAVTGETRFSAYPDIPTVKEATGLDFVATVDFGFFTTQGTPRPTVDRLYRDMVDVFGTPDMKEKIRQQGFEFGTMSPDDWMAKGNFEVRRAKDIAQAANITPQ